MLRKKEVFTIVTPIPGFIPRQLAIDILHSHSEVITLNPLVLGHKAIAAPRDAAADEFYSTWYEITERIQYIPGMGKMGSGKISFNGCFHDMPWGLQTHVYAPMNIDLRNKYRIAGNQPGVEPPEPVEIGMAELGVPSDGLYLREDIEIKCNITMVGFIKNQLKAANKEMVQRIIKKAELLDAGVLQAMIQDGKLKTWNPNDRRAGNRSSTMSVGRAPSTAPSNYSTGSGGGGGPSSPGLSYHSSVNHGHPYSPYLQQGSGQSPPPQHQQQQQQQYAYQQGQQQQQQQYSPNNVYPPKPEPIAPVEMPGDFYHPQVLHPTSPPQTSPGLAPPPLQPSPLFHNSSHSRPNSSSYQVPSTTVTPSPQQQQQQQQQSFPSPQPQQPQGFTSLPSPPQQLQQQQHLQQQPGQQNMQPPNGRWSLISSSIEPSNRSSVQSRPDSIAQTPAGYTSPPIDQKSWEAGQHDEAGDTRGAPPPYNK